MFSFLEDSRFRFSVFTFNSNFNVDGIIDIIVNSISSMLKDYFGLFKEVRNAHRLVFNHKLRNLNLPLLQQ